MMKIVAPAVLLLITLLTACGSSKRNYDPGPQSPMRYDTVTRSWVPLSTPNSRVIPRDTQMLAPEKASSTAQIIETTAPAIPVKPGTDVPVEDKPGFLKRVGRAATSPLRVVGIGD